MSEDEEILDEITVQKIRNSDAECAAYYDRIQRALELLEAVEKLEPNSALLIDELIQYANKITKQEGEG